jgi:allophanate hydrolase
MTGLIAACFSATLGTANAEPLKIGYSDWPGWVAWEIGIKKGWFKEGFTSPNDLKGKTIALAKWPRLGGCFRFGVPDPDSLEFHGWEGAGDLFDAAARRLEVIGGERVRIDLSPFLSAARLLYEGPWVTERYVGIRDFLKEKPGAVHPVARAIIEGGESPLASDFFSAQYKLAECKRLTSQQMGKVDLILLPTAPRNFTLAEVAAEPVKLNSILGTYTNFMNLLDYSALALPAGKY